jgi:hypothetical protein
MKKEVFKQFSELSINLMANIRLLELANNRGDKNAVDFFISELQKDRQRIKEAFDKIDFNI